MDTAKLACLLALGILTPHLPGIAITGRLLHLLSVYVGPGVLILDPYAWTASVLFTESSLQSLDVLS